MANLAVLSSQGGYSGKAFLTFALVAVVIAQLSASWTNLSTELVRHSFIPFWADAWADAIVSEWCRCLASVLNKDNNLLSAAVYGLCSLSSHPHLLHHLIIFIINKKKRIPSVLGSVSM